MSEEAHIDPETWIDLYGDYLYRYAYARLRESASAEEVVQETFLAGLRAQSQFSGRGSERGWLLGILKRKIVDHIRSRAKHGQASAYDDDRTDPSEQLFDAQGNWKSGVVRWSGLPDEKIQSRELWTVVRGCLANLPKGQADVFTLSVMEEMESEEICRELGISSSNLWVRLHRARLSLASCVGSRWFQDEEASSHAQ